MLSVSVTALLVNDLSWRSRPRPPSCASRPKVAGRQSVALCRGGGARLTLKSAWRAGLTGFGLQLSNPKAIFFWLAIASVGGVGDAPPSVILLFVAVAFVNSFVGHGGYALLLSSKPIRHVYFRFCRWVEGTMGCFFLFASYKLAMAKE